MVEGKSGVIKAITNPLGFFALSLLVVEGFLGIVLVASNLDVWQKFWGMIIGSILFTLVGFGVWLLVWFNPENIVKAGEDYIEEKKIDLEIEKIAQSSIRTDTTEGDPDIPKEKPKTLLINVHDEIKLSDKN